MSDTTGQQIATDITLADQLIAPIVTGFDPVVGQGLSLGLKLLAIAEPAIYNAVVAVLQGTPLTAQQQSDMAAALTRLKNPGQYFK